MQDDGLLYISAVSAEGVELMTLDAQTKKPRQWMDTWADWQQRCKLRTVLFTGQRRPLVRAGMRGVL
jgi:hypothetical protein